jgi:hypothetical protein
MIAPKRVQQAYDHRLRQFVCTTGDTDHALRIGVPRSTANGWLQPRAQLLEKTTIIGKFGSKISSDFLCSLRRLKSDPRSLGKNSRIQRIHIGATPDSGLGASSFFAR